jgi:hypothetical protein
VVNGFSLGASRSDRLLSSDWQLVRSGRHAQNSAPDVGSESLPVPTVSDRLNIMRSESAHWQLGRVSGIS